VVESVEVLFTFHFHERNDSMRGERTGEDGISVFISGAALRAHSSPPTQLASGVKQQIHTVMTRTGKCVYVHFVSVAAAWPGVGKAPQLCSRLTVWQTARCGIWRDSSLVADTWTPESAPNMGPKLVFIKVIFKHF